MYDPHNAHDGERPMPRRHELQRDGLDQPGRLEVPSIHGRVTHLLDQVDHPALRLLPVRRHGDLLERGRRRSKRNAATRKFRKINIFFFVSC